LEEREREREIHSSRIERGDIVQCVSAWHAPTQAHCMLWPPRRRRRLKNTALLRASVCGYTFVFVWTNRAHRTSPEPHYPCERSRKYITSVYECVGVASVVREVLQVARSVDLLSCLRERRCGLALLM